MKKNSRTDRCVQCHKDRAADGHTDGCVLRRSMAILCDRNHLPACVPPHKLPQLVMLFFLNDTMSSISHALQKHAHWRCALPYLLPSRVPVYLQRNANSCFERHLVSAELRKHCGLHSCLGEFNPVASLYRRF